jgi:hypothetical protein
LENSHEKWPYFVGVDAATASLGMELKLSAVTLDVPANTRLAAGSKV